MAFNVQVFKTRALTAVVFAAAMLFGLLLNYWSFLILFCIIHFGCWIEYIKIAGLISPEYKNATAIDKSLMPILGFAFMTFMTNNLISAGALTLSRLGLYGMLICFVALVIKVIAKRNFKMLSLSLIGFLNISLSCGLMIGLRTNGVIAGSAFSLDFGLILPLSIIITIWINDTMAYIVGSLIGRTQLSPVSPKKTWEGTIGGALLAMATVTYLGFVFLRADVLHLILITGLICATGVCGDLFESKLKRMAGVKDSGRIMPGHGGFLDRFDSLLFATIFVWLYVQLFLI